MELFLRLFFKCLAWSDLSDSFFCLLKIFIEAIKFGQQFFFLLSCLNEIILGTFQLLLQSGLVLLISLDDLLVLSVRLVLIDFIWLNWRKLLEISGWLWAIIFLVRECKSYQLLIMNLLIKFQRWYHTVWTLLYWFVDINLLYYFYWSLNFYNHLFLNYLFDNDFDRLFNYNLLNHLYRSIDYNLLNYLDGSVHKIFLYNRSFHYNFFDDLYYFLHLYFLDDFNWLLYENLSVDLNDNFLYGFYWPIDKNFLDDLYWSIHVLCLYHFLYDLYLFFNCYFLYYLYRPFYNYFSVFNPFNRNFFNNFNLFDYRSVNINLSNDLSGSLHNNFPYSFIWSLDEDLLHLLNRNFLDDLNCSLDYDLYWLFNDDMFNDLFRSLDNNLLLNINRSFHNDFPYYLNNFFHNYLNLYHPIYNYLLLDFNQPVNIDLFDDLYGCFHYDFFLYYDFEGHFLYNFHLYFLYDFNLYLLLLNGHPFNRYLHYLLHNNLDRSLNYNCAIQIYYSFHFNYLFHHYLFYLLHENLNGQDLRHAFTYNLSNHLPVHVNWFLNDNLNRQYFRHYLNELFNVDRSLYYDLDWQDLRHDFHHYLLFNYSFYYHFFLYED